MDKSHHSSLRIKDAKAESTRIQMESQILKQVEAPDDGAGAPELPTEARVDPLLPTATQPVHIYPKAAFELLKLKCPAMRSYCNGGQLGPLGDALISGLNRTLAPFEGGPEAAHQSCGTRPSFNQPQFDTEMAVGRLPPTPSYACAQARADGSTSCPTGGCPLPTGEIATAPAELMAWACDTTKVGPTVIARSIIASEYGNNMVSVKDKLHAYHDGIYSEVDGSGLNRKILRHLGVKGKVKDIFEIGKLLPFLSDRPMEDIASDPNYICFQNGTLNVSARRLESHNPAHMLLNRIGHPYDAEALCLRFLAFLHSIWEGDRDREQKIQLIRQWIGYLLVADCSMQKMLILIGQGANGKSVLMDVIRAIVGEENIASAMLDRFRMPYVRATLDGKLLNQSADLPKRGVVCDDDLKAIISGDSIEVSPKFKPSYTIKTYVRLMVATNNMPSSRDTSDGYFRRLIILTFNRQFAETDRDPHLLQSLLPEIPGIIAWAVGGLYELREQRHFTIPESSAQAVQAYQGEISPVRLFAEECLIRSSDRTGILPKDLYTAFRAWCRERGFNAGNLVTFGRELSALNFDQRKSNKTWWLVRMTEAGQVYFNAAQIMVDTSPPLPTDPLSLPGPSQ